jgi:hypothetical protein
MKTVKMNRTETCLNASGVNQVFGPKGKQFIIDDAVADRLIDSGAASEVGGKKERQKSVTPDE